MKVCQRRRTNPNIFQPRGMDHLSRSNAAVTFYMTHLAKHQRDVLHAPTNRGLPRLSNVPLSQIEFLQLKIMKNNNNNTMLLF